MSHCLRSFLNQLKGKILFIGIGNVLRSDDGVGVFISRNIKPSPFISSLTVETGIENYIGKINKSDADFLIFIDCVDFGKKPGYYDLLPAEKLAGQTFNTHNISLKMISGLFKMPVLILGIQPANTSFGEQLTPEIKNTAIKLLKLIHKK